MKWVLLTLGLAAACSNKAADDATPKTPLKVAVEVTDDGYEPSRIDVGKNQPLTLVFTRTGTSTCGEQVVVPSQNIKVDLPLNMPVEISLTPREPGTIAFACGMDMLKGAIVVR
ncbi:MAG: cupredoxin domain-containing protein [Clostridia bacterium]|nr:cupredoxin domain-containing protein [Deltaproteobacteria bacterium]